MLEPQIPEQVRAGAEHAEQLIAEQKAAEAGETPSAGDKPAEQPADQDADQNPKPEDAAPTVESLTKKVEELTHSLSVLQGKYNAEVKALGDDPNLLNTLKADKRRLDRQVTDLQRIVNDQQAQLARLSSKDSQPPEDPDNEPAVPDIDLKLDKEDLDHLRNEGIEGKTLDIFKKLVAQGADQIVNTRYGKVSDEVKDIRQAQALTAEQQFFSDLTDAVSNWRAINGTPEQPNEDWLEWLDGKAPYQRRTRAEVLHQAQDALDVQTCIDIFKDYIAEKGTANPEPKEPQPDPALKIEPEKLLEPKGAPAGDSPVPEGPRFTMADYKKHNDEYTKGLWRGREEEWKQINAAMEKAFAEGRMTK